MFPVSSRKIKYLFLLFILVCSFKVNAQKMHYFDTRDFNLGFTMGLNYAGYDARIHADQYDPVTRTRMIDAHLVRKPGIYLGLITNLKIADNFDLRFLPSVSLEERVFNFIMDSSTTGGISLVEKKVEASNLNLPFVIKFKSNYYKHVRVYVQFGVQPSFNLSSNKKVKNDPDLLKTQKFDIATVASVGVDLYGEKLKLSPELRFTRGIYNIYVPDRTKFPFAITSLFSQLLVFNINFE